ncbi:hypothetical protein LZ30DRAFT_777478 [Colletotrichum cereale]|nr:hypothetical protein LZ30DRAFT_777478 [Colletotrichum cereale]
MRFFTSEMTMMMTTMTTIGVDHDPKIPVPGCHLGLMTVKMGLGRDRKILVLRRLGRITVSVVLEGNLKTPIPRHLGQMMAIMGPDHDHRIPVPLHHLVDEATICTAQKQAPPKPPGGPPGRPYSSPDQPDDDRKPPSTVDCD